MKGLCSDIPKKNMEAMGIKFGNETTKVIRSLQHFITNSKWDDIGVRKAYEKIVVTDIGDFEGAYIYDDTDIEKVGKKSVGVANQYNGRLGHKTLSQAAQILQYCGGDGLGWARNNIKLYMPKKWFSNEYKDLRKKCRVPENLTFKKKNEIGLELLNESHSGGKFPAKCFFLTGLWGMTKPFLMVFQRRYSILVPSICQINFLLRCRHAPHR
jgi:SRSO17 transposase